MTRALKVYGTLSHRAFRNNRQARVIVAATSFAEAARLFTEAMNYHFSPSYLQTYGGTTGNANELRIATAEPGTVFIGGAFYVGPYFAVRNGVISGDPK